MTSHVIKETALTSEQGSELSSTAGIGKAKDEKKKEKNLTVKPFRLQLEEPKHTLKQTLNIVIKASDVCPLETQIAGHGSCNDGQRGMLMHESGFVLKPVQAPPKGAREVSFYQTISTSTIETDVQFKALTAKFFGTESVKESSGDLSEYLVFENLTQGFAKPCVMDVKIGAVTYGPDASDAKKGKEAQSYAGTKIPFGFSVLGIISHSSKGFKRWTKAFGRSLKEDNIKDVLRNYLDIDNGFAKIVARCFLEKLDEFIDFFSKQTTYHVYASSLLFVYDYEALEAENFNLRNPVRLKLIDFAHVFPGNGELDNNFLFGLKNLSDLFRKFLNQ